ncbi:MAG: GtrA family protein [Eggerthellaceae bacterium]|nr:GtrA family protein [Eggerthellaceae bacterium]
MGLANIIKNKQAISKNNTAQTFAFYVAVGLTTALLELVLFYIQDSLLGLGITFANISAVSIATVTNFLLNRGVSFKAASSVIISAIFYLLLFFFNMSFSTTVIHELNNMGIHASLAKIFSMACIVAWNFILFRTIVFPDENYKQFLNKRALEQGVSQLELWLARNSIGTRHIIFILFVLLFLLTLLFPFTGDDWGWGSSVGIERLLSGYQDYNGRYFSNTLMLVLGRSAVARGVFVAATVSLISYAIYRFVKKDHVVYLIISAVLFLLVPKDVAAQGFIWISGFVNYVFPALITFAYLLLSFEIAENRYDGSPAVYGGVFFLGLFGALIVENVTFLHLGLSLLLFIGMKLRYNFMSKIHAIFFMGSAIGALIMFSNGAYHRIAAGDDSYRSVVSGLSDIVSHIFDGIVFSALANPVFLTVTILVLSAGLLLKDGKIGYSSIPALSILLILMWRLIHKSAGALVNEIFGLFVLVSFFATLALVCIGFYRKQSSQAFRLFLLIVSVVLLVGPLVEAHPIGPRNFMTTYLFEIAIAIILLQEMNIKYTSLMTLISVAIFALAYIYWILTFLPIHNAELERIASIDEQLVLEQDVITIEKMPRSELLWHANPGFNEDSNVIFKAYYGIPEDVDVVVQDNKV